MTGLAVYEEPRLAAVKREGAQPVYKLWHQGRLPINLGSETPLTQVAANEAKDVPRMIEAEVVRRYGPLLGD